MASGCLLVLSDTLATKDFVFLPIFVLVMSTPSSKVEVIGVRFPDLNFIMLPVKEQHELDRYSINQQGEAT